MSLKDRLRKFQLQQHSQIEVASPCPADWEEMEGDEKVRFCGGCQRHVFNLSAMDVEEAGARMAEHADGICVRFYRRNDGTLLTQDCPVGLERKQRRRRLVPPTPVEVAAMVAICGVLGAILFPVFSPVTGEVARPLTRQVLKHRAVVSGDLERLRSMIEADHDPETVDRFGRTLLMSAAEVGSAETIKLLLQHGADPVARDADGRSALDVALAEKQWKVATLLKNAGGSR